MNGQRVADRRGYNPCAMLKRRLHRITSCGIQTTALHELVDDLRYQFVDALR